MKCFESWLSYDLTKVNSDILDVIDVDCSKDGCGDADG